jgi:hypothetical protein
MPGSLEVVNCDRLDCSSLHLNKIAFFNTVFDYSTVDVNQVFVTVITQPLIAVKICVVCRNWFITSVTSAKLNHLYSLMMLASGTVEMSKFQCPIRR